MQSTPGSGLWSILGYFGLFFLIALLFYVFYAVILMVLARKTRTPGAGLAWLPIGNLILLCRVAQRPGWWVLLLFIPVVNIVVLAMLWASVADVRGKPAFIGALAILPLIGLFIHIYLIIGNQPAPPTSDATIVSRTCQTCGQAIIGNDVFCRACGASAPTAVAAGWPTAAMHAPTGLGAITAMGAGSAFVTMVIYGVAAWFLLFSAMSYTPPDRQQPDLPERTSGTLVEFPVDTGSNAPTPGSISVEDLSGGAGGMGNAPSSTSSSSSGKMKTPPERFPPGITISILTGKGATTATTAVYTPKKQQQPKDKIYVCVLRGPNDLAAELAKLVMQSTGGQLKGVELTSSKGQKYAGSKITTSEIAVYILQKVGADVVVIIYAPTPAVQEEAGVMATNVGNGNGLNDYPAVKNTYWVLPRTPPGGLTLIDFQVQSHDQMLAGTNNGGSTSDQRDLNNAISQFIPEQATYARYGSTGGRDWEVIVFDYGNTRSAWNTWMLFRYTIGAGAMQPVSVRSGDALWVESGSDRVLMFQKGPYLIFIKAPSTSSTSNLVEMANLFQI